MGKWFPYPFICISAKVACYHVSQLCKCTLATCLKTKISFFIKLSEKEGRQICNSTKQRDKILLHVPCIPNLKCRLLFWKHNASTKHGRSRQKRFWLSNKSSGGLLNTAFQLSSVLYFRCVDMTLKHQNADIHSTLTSWQAATVQLHYHVTLFDCIKQIPPCLQKESNSFSW